jgi:electron transport complex protein RnfG
MSDVAPSIPTPRPGRMLGAMVGVGLACGLLIVSVFVATGPTIQRNRRAALEEAILHVLPGAERHATFALGEDDRFQAVGVDTAAGPRVHAGYDAGGRLVGVAVEAEGMGYQDVIELLYGYSLELDAIVGVRVLASRETPGLGDRIESDPDFLRNFERLDVSLAAGGEALAHAIELVKPGEKRDAWQVDGITGATISSEAIANILGRSAAWWVPRIERAEADMGSGG